MKFLLIGMLLLAGVSVARADEHTAPLIKCLSDGEKQGVANKDCPAFDKALDCQAQLLRFYQGHLDGAKGDLARINEEISGSRSTKRRQLLTRAANEEKLAVAAEEKSVAQSKEGDAILKREKHEAGCD